MSRVEVIQQPVAVVKDRERTPSVPVNSLVLQYYDQEHIALRRYLLLTGLDDPTAQEIVQETFLKLHGHLGKDGDRSNLRAWLYRVARNLALNEHASARRRRTETINGTLAEETFASNENSPEARFLQGERETQLRKAIGKLSLSQRECLLLRSQGMKYREIADILDISVASVGENIQRGLESLKELL
jgi:RNA polymerase sigma-70 factor (ECF subfamily)